MPLFGRANKETSTVSQISYHFGSLQLKTPLCGPLFSIRRLFKNWFMLSVRISSYGCAREVWRARKKRKSCSRRDKLTSELGFQVGVSS